MSTDNPFEWSFSRPRKKGWYWYRDNRLDRPVMVEIGPRGYGPVAIHARQRHSYYADISNMKGQFCGPLPEPNN